MKDTPKVNRNSITKAVESLLETGSRQATVYQHPKLTVKATRRHKPDKRSRHTEILLTIGTPNYAERAFIKTCLKCGHPFPLSGVQLKAYPAKKR
jgi:hypothetical protein